MIKFYIYNFIGLTLATIALAFPQPGPRLTTEQKTCIENKVGKPGGGMIHNHEAITAAFTACGIQAPPFPNSKTARPNLTSEQKSCMESNIGQPQLGNSPPSKEKIMAALNNCGIQMPPPPTDFNIDPEQAFTQLTNQFAISGKADEKDMIRSKIKDLFYQTNNMTLKSQIRQFLKNNPDEFATPSSDLSVARTNSQK